MSNSIPINTATIQEWLAAKLSLEAIEAELQEKGFDAHAIAEHIREFKKIKSAKRQFIGFVCMCIGAVLGFISCMLTVTNIFPSLYNTFLYGLTMVSVTLIVIGLYLVFE